jgi:hypothetical protein
MVLLDHIVLEARSLIYAEYTVDPTSNGADRSPAARVTPANQRDRNRGLLINERIIIPAIIEIVVSSIDLR